jgi:hypothetical protein
MVSLPRNMWIECDLTNENWDLTTENMESSPTEKWGDNGDDGVSLPLWRWLGYITQRPWGFMMRKKGTDEFWSVVKQMGAPNNATNQQQPVFTSFLLSFALRQPNVQSFFTMPWSRSLISPQKIIESFTGCGHFHSFPLQKNVSRISFYPVGGRLLDPILIDHRRCWGVSRLHRIWIHPSNVVQRP